MTSSHSRDLQIRPAVDKDDLDACFAIRRTVFVDEQGVDPSLEFDGSDDHARSILALVGGEPAGTARTLRISMGEVRIGRVAVLPRFRGSGVGRALMEYALEYAKGEESSAAILHAQTSVVGFYERLGFAVEGEEFVEAGIPHYAMRRELNPISGPEIGHPSATPGQMAGLQSAEDPSGVGVKATRALIEGTVYRGNSGNYSVRPRGGGEDYIVRLRGNLKKEFEYSTSGSRPRRVTRARKRRATDPVTVGDHVLIDPATGSIESVLERKTELARMTPSGREQHVLVANLDIVFVVFAAANPAPDLRLLDRFLVLAESAELSPAIVVNKCDLAENMAAVRETFAAYERVGYSVLYTAAKKGQGIEALLEALRGKISAFTGPSGVGKSSLLNTIQPGLQLKTAVDEDISRSGRHTTTHAELIPMEFDADTWVADTPGLRSVDFWEIEPADVELCFPELEPYAGTCQFADCKHNTEPGCAVRAAAAGGDIDRRRYESFLALNQEAATAAAARLPGG